MNLTAALRKAGNVKRYHTRFTIQTQTLSQHVFGLMRIYTAIWGAPNEPVFMRILYHDFAELFTGDIPYDADKTLKQACKKVEDEVLGTVHPAVELITEDKNRISVCDTIDALEFVLDEISLGNTASFTLESLEDRYHQLLAMPAYSVKVGAYLAESGFVMRYIDIGGRVS